jgi:Protein of unknown function (DUF1064)
MSMARPVRLPKRTKYRAIRTVVDGISFASKKEARRYSELKLMEKAGEIARLKWQVPFDLKVNSVKICRYVADFTYDQIVGYNPGGPTDSPLDSPFEVVVRVVEDTKGFRTPLYRLKARLMDALYGIKILET